MISGITEYAKNTVLYSTPSTTIPPASMNTERMQETVPIARATKIDALLSAVFFKKNGQIINTNGTIKRDNGYTYSPLLEVIEVMDLDILSTESQSLFLSSSSKVRNIAVL